jgi:hypothetical protein
MVKHGEAVRTSVLLLTHQLARQLRGEMHFVASDPPTMRRVLGSPPCGLRLSFLSAGFSFSFVGSMLSVRIRQVPKDLALGRLAVSTTMKVVQPSSQQHVIRSG